MDRSNLSLAASLSGPCPGMLASGARFGSCDLGLTLLLGGLDPSLFTAPGGMTRIPRAGSRLRPAPKPSPMLFVTFVPPPLISCRQSFPPCPVGRAALSESDA